MIFPLRDLILKGFHPPQSKTGSHESYFRLKKMAEEAGNTYSLKDLNIGVGRGGGAGGGGVGPTII